MCTYMYNQSICSYCDVPLTVRLAPLMNRGAELMAASYSRHCSKYAYCQLYIQYTSKISSVVSYGKTLMKTVTKW